MRVCSISQRQRRLGEGVLISTMRCSCGEVNLVSLGRRLAIAGLEDM
jgi:hypothetical protein